MTSLEDMWFPGATLRLLVVSERQDIWLMLMFTFSLIGALVSCSRLRTWKRDGKNLEVKECLNSARVQDLRPFKGQHELASTLIELFDKDGAGAWPPKANHTSWPEAVRAYKDIYLELVSLLPAAEPSLDDEVNNVRRENYRSLMRTLLTERVDTNRVQGVLAAVEAGNWDIFPRDAYNGFYCAVAVCRHAYR